MQIVKAGVEGRHAVHASGKIMALTTGCPWKEHLLDLETEAGIEGEITYVLYPDESKNWRVQTVPLTPSSFDSRLMLPEAWRGIRGSVLQEACGVPDAEFVHASGFIGGALSFESAKRMAVLALQVLGKIPKEE